MDRILILAGSLAAVSLWGCQPPPEHHEEEGSFAVTTPLRQDVELSRKYVAQVRASQHIDVRAQERGYLTEIFVDEGQRIEEGKKMFQIMPFIYQAEVGRAQAEADMAKIEYENTKMLADKDIVSPAELALAKAKLARAKAELSLAQTHMRLTEIHAPFTGLMDRFEVRLGSLVEEGELLTTLSDNTTLWIYFNVPEAEYLDYEQRNEPMVVDFEMANGKLFDQQGKVETIEADFDNTTGNIAFRATFPNPRGLLRHGETGSIIVRTPHPNAMLIPQKATFEILDRKYVFVVDEEGVVHQRAVHIAAELNHIFVIDEGLEDTDKVLIDGLRKVNDGKKIETRFEEPKTVFSELNVYAE
ncbi:MAG: efflux RND transporter periplasmic adaptor subunit [Myxococcales bacterium]|nr:efflux RND transporter periplasmic adaptor subunit [Myxococcales bacterium]MCB9718614.1 efflux RND transporter periplasmic adaptor subunit [Myxococcales bacterium]